MEEVKTLLEARKKQLLQVKKQKEKALKSVPTGTLRICSSKNRTQYYHRTDPKDFNGTYIRENDFYMAKKLAQKDYDKKVLDATEQEVKIIDKYLSGYPKKNMEQIYEGLHKERQKLVIPVKEPDEQYVSAWESAEYEGKIFYDYMPQLYTMKGERVRSKSEVIIADLLNREGIPYRYEYPVYLDGVGQVYPDFTVLNVRLRKEIFWEHFGMMDDPDYAEKTIQKIASYETNGYFPGENLILTYETKNNPINQKLIMLMIERYLL